MHTLIALLFLLLPSSQPQIPQSRFRGDHFQVRADKNIPAATVGEITGALEFELAKAESSLGISATRRIPVVIYTTELRYRSDSKSLAFDDADMKGGTIHLSYPALKRDRAAWAASFARVVTKALIGEVLFCPPWLQEAYALHAGAATTRFGDPARVASGGFGDLFEEYSRAERPKDVREAFAKLAFTIEFLVERFGEERVRSLFPRFRSGRDIESIFAETFGEQMVATEAAWAATLKAAARR